VSVRTILVGVDDSPGSLAALRWAADLAGPLRASLVLLHVYEPLAHVDELQPGVDLRMLRERTEASLQAVCAAQLQGRGVEHRLMVREGMPLDVLVDVADEVSADLIVVGARRLGRVEALLLGSTSSRLAQRTRRPVVVLHQGAEAH
jgi:nucleotide-binding universal stress UspA family protein